jgi:hypothetical protein
MNWIGILTGILQVLVPAGVSYAAGKGLISSTALNEIVAITVAVLGSLHSATTTTGVAPTNGA